LHANSPGAAYRFVLSARRIERIEALAQDLVTAHGIRAECIAADLADPTAPTALCAEMQRRGIAIDILVNNAGYGVTGHYESKSWQTHADFIQVMLTAPCELVHKLLPAMQQRKYGRVINVASLAGLLPGTAGHTLYGAAKAFLIKFSQSLALENRRHGVCVTAVCPGFTYSEFHDVNGTRPLVSKMPKWMWLGADEVARQGVDASERGDIVFVTGRANRAIKSLVKLLPDRLALRLIKKRSKNFRAAE
jgi:uncharacterized protein